MEQFKWTDFVVTCAFFAIAIKPSLAAAVKGTFGIVALSIGITVVRIGGTLVYICRNKSFPLIMQLKKKIGISFCMHVLIG